MKKIIRQKDLMKLYDYPIGHQWEDKYKRFYGYCISDSLYREIGIVKTLDKKEAVNEFNRRVKNKEYRLDNETYLEYKDRRK
jgi:hypothetical protein